MASQLLKKKRPMVRPDAYLNGGVKSYIHLVQQAQWPFFNTASALPFFTGPRMRTWEGPNFAGMRNSE